MLAILTKMTLTQVSTWFANARRRLKKENKMTWSPRKKSGDKKLDGKDDDSDASDSDIECMDVDVDGDPDSPLIEGMCCMCMSGYFNIVFCRDLILQENSL